MNFDPAFWVSTATGIILVANFFVQQSIKRALADLQVTLYRDFVTWQALESNRADRDEASQKQRRDYRHVFDHQQK